MGNCGAVGRWPRGRCAACTRTYEGRRREQRIITYSEPWWRLWRVGYVSDLILKGIPPVCGARLPGVAPHFVTPCQQQDMKTMTSNNGTSLHFHHEPELTEAEQRNRDAVCDANRIVLACDSCHNAIDPSRRRRSAA